MKVAIPEKFDLEEDMVVETQVTAVCIQCHQIQVSNKEMRRVFGNKYIGGGRDGITFLSTSVDYLTVIICYGL